MTQSGNSNYIVEYRAVGKSVKVTVFDPVTLREVSIVGSTRTSRKQLADVAISKLHYMLAKDKSV
jgi:hypothetical protein